MTTNTARVTGSFDLLPEIKDIVRDCVKQGMITTITLKEFDQQTRLLKDAELEEYLQTLWDEV